MTARFKVGDRVSWNSEERQSRGTIIEVHTRNMHSRGFTLEASEDDPQCEIQSAITGETALIRGSLLRKQND